MKNIIILAIVFFALFFLYRSCTKGYDNYAYFVQVNDEAVFAKVLSKGDTRIIEHGRKLKTDVIIMDEKIDQGNGPNQGTIRWYTCSGIDCDEGWQRSFRPAK
ncbi:MAG: hypothetical protein SWH54_11185 [Thermodesulfobacteriota bacterium]|nr:hypothetical protein [Thermodesulfobacteriota bacterium]